MDTFLEDFCAFTKGNTKSCPESITYQDPESDISRSRSPWDILIDLTSTNGQNTIPHTQQDLIEKTPLDAICGFLGDKNIWEKLFQSDCKKCKKQVQHILKDVGVHL